MKKPETKSELDMVERQQKRKAHLSDVEEEIEEIEEIEEMNDDGDGDEDEDGLLKVPVPRRDYIRDPELYSSIPKHNVNRTVIDLNEEKEPDEDEMALQDILAKIEYKKAFADLEARCEADKRARESASTTTNKRRKESEADPSEEYPTPATGGLGNLATTPRRVTAVVDKEERFKETPKRSTTRLEPKKPPLQSGKKLAHQDSATLRGVIMSSNSLPINSCQDINSSPIVGNQSSLPFDLQEDRYLLPQQLDALDDKGKERRRLLQQAKVLNSG